MTHWVDAGKHYSHVLSVWKPFGDTVNPIWQMKLYVSDMKYIVHGSNNQNYSCFGASLPKRMSDVSTRFYCGHNGERFSQNGKK